MNNDLKNQCGLSTKYLQFMGSDALTCQAEERTTAVWINAPAGALSAGLRAALPAGLGVTASPQPPHSLLVPSTGGREMPPAAELGVAQVLGGLFSTYAGFLCGLRRRGPLLGETLQERLMRTCFRSSHFYIGW